MLMQFVQFSVNERLNSKDEQNRTVNSFCLIRTVKIICPATLGIGTRNFLEKASTCSICAKSKVEPQKSRHPPAIFSQI